MPVSLAPVAPVAPSLQRAPCPFVGAALVVAFAAAERLDGLAARDRIPLAVAPELAPGDGYLVLPLRARAELAAAFARGAEGRVAQWFDEALVVRGEADTRRAPLLRVASAWAARDVLAGEAGARLPLGAPGDVARAVNALPGARALGDGALLDAAGAAAVTGRAAYVGLGRRDAALEPAYVWSRRAAGRVTLLVALAAPEEDAAVAVLVPAVLG